MAKNTDLGWSAKPQADLYTCGLANLSDDEKEFLFLVFEKFVEYSKENELSEEAAVSAAITEIMVQTQAQEQIELDDEQSKYLLHAAISHLARFAPLDKMLEDSQIEEIACIGLNKPIYVYLRKKGWQASDASFTNYEHLIHVINKMSRPLGRRITNHTPRINAVLPSGHRLHASIPPLSDGEITIRLHSSKPWSIADILSSHCTTAGALAFLWLAFQSDSSLLIAGNTSSGKTTLLNSLFSFIPKDERILRKSVV